MMQKLAQGTSGGGINLYEGGSLKGFGALGDSGLGDPFSTFNKLMSSIIGLITIIAVIWFMFVVITGAVGIMMAGGDKGAVQKNTQKITNGIIGLVVLVASLYIINLVGYLLGLGNIVLNPAQAVLDKLQL